MASTSSEVSEGSVEGGVVVECVPSRSLSTEKTSRNWSRNVSSFVYPAILSISLLLVEITVSKVKPLISKIPCEARARSVMEIGLRDATMEVCSLHSSQLSLGRFHRETHEGHSPM